MAFSQERIISRYYYARLVQTLRINIKDLKSEMRDRKMSELPGSRDRSSSSFIQFAPAKAPLKPSTLQGVSITFPDGVNLTLQESSVESVISLLTYINLARAGRRYVLTRELLPVLHVPTFSEHAQGGIDSLFNLVVSESPISPMSGEHS